MQGQFLDHDLVATLDDHDGQSFPIEITDDGQTATMQLTRLKKEGEVGQCKTPINTVTPQIDAGTVYSPDEEYLQVGTAAILHLKGTVLTSSGIEPIPAVVQQ